MKEGALSHLAVPGGTIAVRAMPNASRNAVIEEAGQVRVYVTMVAEGGKANREVQRLLAQALGVAKTALILECGQTARDKVFRLDSAG